MRRLTCHINGQTMFVHTTAQDLVSSHGLDEIGDQLVNYTT